MVIWLIGLVNEVIRVYGYIILARVLLSWVEPNPYNPIVRFIYNVTEPVLRPLRIIIKTGNMGIDLSPLIAFFLLEFLRRGVVNFLYYLAGV